MGRRDRGPRSGRRICTAGRSATGSPVPPTTRAAFCQKCVEGHYNLCENYGKSGLHKQYGHNYQGADATYVVHGVKTVFKLPDGISFDYGAIIDPASIALHVANRGNVAPGDAVAITGGGAIGLLSGDAALIRGAARIIVWSQTPVGARRRSSSASRRWIRAQAIPSRPFEP